MTYVETFVHVLTLKIKPLVHFEIEYLSFAIFFFIERKVVLLLAVQAVSSQSSKYFPTHHLSDNELKHYELSNNE